MIRLEIPGIQPMPKKRPRHDGRSGRMHMPQDYLDWKCNFAGLAGLRWREWLVANGYPAQSHVAGPIAVTLTFRTPTGNMRPDLDNAMGAVFDALQDGGVFGNDRQVRECHAAIARGPYAITVEIAELPAQGGAA